MSARLIIFLGTAGLLFGVGLLVIYLFNRTRFILWLLTARKAKDRNRSPVPGFFSGFRNLLVILLLISLSGVVFFIGFFMQAYHRFTDEVPVALLQVVPGNDPRTFVAELRRGSVLEEAPNERYLLHGDMWMLEGDILRWENWLTFLGLHPRYRLTRLRGRYILTKDEQSKPATIYSLVEKEDDPLWRFLYRVGGSLPFVNTVHGSAVYQYGADTTRYRIYVTSSGFTVRQISDDNQSSSPGER